jgi:hypothetical protein
VIWVAVIAAVAVVTVAALVTINRQAARGAGESAPLRPPSSACTWCQPVPGGMCTCTSVCGHIRCIGDHTSMAVLTAADMRMLHKWIKEGRE